jgi:hypothetical protein
MTILTIKEKVEQGETVTIPTQCLPELMQEAERHNVNLRWMISVEGKVTRINRHNNQYDQDLGHSNPPPQGDSDDLSPAT